MEPLFVLLSLVGACNAGYHEASSESQFVIIPALRYLSQAAFAKALMRGSRGVDLVQENLAQTLAEDKNDCAKRLICELQRKPDQSWEEDLIANVVSKSISYSSPTIQLEVAAKVGSTEGTDQCSTTFNRCPFNATVAMDALRKRGTGLDITTEEGTCSILFLWNRLGGSLLLND